jgi:translation initiation factor IF-2
VLHDCYFAGVTINTYKVIYNLIDDVKAAMEGKLRTVEERQPLGSATVRKRLSHFLVLSGHARLSSACFCC